MNPILTSADYAALSPLLILLAGGLLLLLLESFAEKWARKFSFTLAAVSIVLAFAAAYFAPISENPLLTPWIRFDTSARFFTLFFLVIGLASALFAYAFFQKFEASAGGILFSTSLLSFWIDLHWSCGRFLTLFLGLETLIYCTLYFMWLHEKMGSLA